MENEILIRGAGPEDIPTIGWLAHQIWPATYGKILSPPQMAYMLDRMYSPQALQDQMFQEKHQFLLAAIQDRPVGYASFGPLPLPGGFKLHKIYVRTDIQGKGLGKALMAAVWERLRLLQARTLELNVNRHNNALGFYQKLGFEITGEVDIDIGNGYFMNDYIMRKTF